MSTPQIFISYSHNNNFAQMFIELFKAEIEVFNGSGRSLPPFRVWTDHELTAGDNWADEIDEGIKKSFAVLVIVTPEANDSHFVTYEWSYAMGLSRFVVPIILQNESIDPATNTKTQIKLHAKLQPLQWTNVSDVKSYRPHVRELISKLEKEYTRLRTQELILESRQKRQIILSDIEHAQRQRRIGDLHNALQSFHSAQVTIEEFNQRSDLPLQESALHDLTDDVYYELARTYYLLGDDTKSKAEEYFNKALDFNPSHVFSLIGMGILFRERADEADIDNRHADKDNYLRTAHDYFDQAAHKQRDVMDHNDESIWASLAGICKRQGDVDKATAYYKEATRYKQSAYPYGNLGLLYFEQENVDRTIANFRVSYYFANTKLKLQPDDHWSHNDILVAQTFLNAGGKEIEKSSRDEVESFIERLLIISSPETLRRLQSVLKEIIALNKKYKKNHQSKDVIDVDIANYALQLVTAKLTPPQAST